MFIKAFSPEHFNLGDEAQSEILHFSKRGHLSNAQEKRANMFSELTKDYVPAEGKTAVHTLAMTAFEKFGFNRNGDGWKAASLQRDHPTFVSNAKVFRHHRNTSADPDYGVVKASCYNKDMDRVELLMELDNEKCAEELSLLEKQGSYPVSMACFPGDTAIRVEEGFKAIRDIRAGDKVYTDQGRYRRVTVCSRREADSLVEISLGCSGGRVLRATENHPILVTDFSKITRTIWPSKKTRLKHRNRLVDNLKFVNAGNVQAKQYAFIPTPDLPYSDLAVDEARLLGYVMGDGCYSVSRRNIALTDHKQGRSSAGFTAVCHRLGYAATERPHGSCTNAVSVEVHSVALAKKLDGIFDAGKHISSAIFGASIEARLAFVSAWLECDGFVTSGRVCWSVCDRRRSSDLQLLLASCGIAATITRIQHPSDRGGVTGGDGVEYVVSVTGQDIDTLRPWVEQMPLPAVRSGVRTSDVLVIPDVGLLLPIRKVTRSTGIVVVYNFSVEEDETYTAETVAVHNCRVPHDVCSICENKAKTPKDYCWHAKEAMGKILDDGRMVGVDNPHSVFFDISRVIRPADRVAYTLKRANANGVISGADLALELGYDDSAYQDFNATMECSFKAAAEKRQLHDKISRMEKRVPAEVRPLMLDNEQEVADTVAKLAMYGPMYFDSVMRGLMDNQVLLRPSEFYTLVTGKHLDAKTAHDLNVKAAALSQYSADELSNSAVYEPALIKVSGRIADLCKELKSYRGLGEMSPGRFDGCAKPTSHTKAASSASPEMAAWCQEYGRYMLETYRQVKEACQTDRDLESMILCGFCQNQLK